jgi:L-alanine-DL-glutamate epimerase-like enolase superfamily enzyme
LRDSDVRVRQAEVNFLDVNLEQVFGMSRQAITWFTVALVSLTVEDRRGNVAAGSGASVLSIPWSWPESALPVSARDGILRRLTTDLAGRLVGCDPTDPIHSWRDAEQELGHLAACSAQGQGEAVPTLATALALGAVDNAMHDAWARAADLPAYRMYDAEHLTDDLGALLGAQHSGYFPDKCLVAPRRSVPIQHVVGTTDPLEPDPSNDARSLRDWLRSDRVREVKIKLAGRDPDEDARRVVSVYHVVRETIGTNCSLALDPNEGYSSVAMVETMLDVVAALEPEASSRLRYVEQPVSREARPEPGALRRLGRRLPVVIDEALASLEALRSIGDDGWSGAVIKASKGQTPALLTCAVTRSQGLFRSMQDLTAVDLALEHSARLASVLDLSVPHLEYNSRQYAPAANRRLASLRPELVAVRDGAIEVGRDLRPGIY